MYKSVQQNKKIYESRANDQNVQISFQKKIVEQN